jgi:acyl-coenzyme A synthetase/AMP-(fatty) acid ligase
MVVRSSFPEVEIPEMPFTPFVLRHAERLAATPAMVDGVTGRSYSYGQLADAVRHVATSLAQRGFGKGDVLALYTP